MPESVARTTTPSVTSRIVVMTVARDSFWKRVTGSGRSLGARAFGRRRQGPGCGFSFYAAGHEIDAGRPLRSCGQARSRGPGLRGSLGVPTSGRHRHVEPPAFQTTNAPPAGTPGVPTGGDRAGWNAWRSTLGGLR